ncbi:MULTISPECIES: hypothetical protein [Sphingosinicellaceae]|uniref:hypothetical protein n=1 Tax=Sphingosinicellaceae TaxID=2820280 RepID=UPI001C73F2A0|nr:MULTISPECIES: hypothetical protein [Polymorphobacter]QYE35684.1 hypothetical protein KZX46_06835 [Polymorphobacter sp. PAMC 29334]UAJ10948.1 hypothetical protein KTC28_04325 [Polymorphobacter megasporae]
MLIDGGPAGTWNAVAGPYIRSVIGPGGTLDVVLVSHIDADHIVGVLDLLAEIERDNADGADALVVRDLWHNSFADTVDTPEGAVGRGLQAILDVAGSQQMEMRGTADSFFGIAEGARLRRSAARIGVPVNAAFAGGVIRPDGSARFAVDLADVRLTVVGPTAANLGQLRTAWLRWIADHGDRMADAAALANADRSVPNLSSVVLLAEADGRRMLLTGDARGDHILQGLEAAGLLVDGRIALDLLKVQHHGSDRNADAGFFERVTADVYVISANGKHGNPDLQTLVWIVEAAKAAGRRVTIIVTHDAPSLAALRGSHPAADWGYILKTVDGPAHVVDL